MMLRKCDPSPSPGVQGRTGGLLAAAQVPFTIAAISGSESRARLKSPRKINFAPRFARAHSKSQLSCSSQALGPAQGQEFPRKQPGSLQGALLCMIKVFPGGVKPELLSGSYLHPRCG